MTELKMQPAVSRKGVNLAVLLFFMVAVAFGVAFHLLDGAALVADVLGDSFPGVRTVETTSAGSTATTSTAGTDSPSIATTTTPSGLVLYEGMSEALALSLWDEQVDSQTNIRRLMTGDVTSIRIDKVAQGSGEVLLDVTVVFKDKTSAPGRIQLLEVGGRYIVGYVSGMRTGETGGYADTVAEPGSEGSAGVSLKDVDVEILNEMIAQQVENQDIVSGIVDGTYTRVAIGRNRIGLGTRTLEITLSDGTSDPVSGELVCITKDVGTTQMCFVTMFKRL